MTVRGIRGATTVDENSKESILSRSKELLLSLQKANHFNIEDIVSIFFSMTSDLNTAFPAEAARQLGWNKVPLFGMQESDVAGGLGKCIRILIQMNSNKIQDEIRHCYLHKAKRLRRDLADTEGKEGGK